MPGNEKKRGTRTKQSWPNTTRKKSEKLKRGMRPEHIELLTTKYERC
jgi:hypothetical protein